jgi:hypothetical protein
VTKSYLLPINKLWKTQQQHVNSTHFHIRQSKIDGRIGVLWALKNYRDNNHGIKTRVKLWLIRGYLQKYGKNLEK